MEEAEAPPVPKRQGGTFQVGATAPIPFELQQSLHAAEPSETNSRPQAHLACTSAPFHRTSPVFYPSESELDPTNWRGYCVAVQDNPSAG